MCNSLTRKCYRSLFPFLFLPLISLMMGLSTTHTHTRVHTHTYTCRSFVFSESFPNKSSQMAWSALIEIIAADISLGPDPQHQYEMKNYNKTHDSSWVILTVAQSSISPQETDLNCFQINLEGKVYCYVDKEEGQMVLGCQPECVAMVADPLDWNPDSLPRPRWGILGELPISLTFSFSSGAVVRIKLNNSCIEVGTVSGMC